MFFLTIFQVQSFNNAVAAAFSVFLIDIYRKYSTRGAFETTGTATTPRGSY